jgi:hypothetical protein
MTVRDKPEVAASKANLMSSEKDSTRFQARFTMVDKRRRQLLFSRGGTYLSEDQLMVFEDYLHISLRRKLNPLPLMNLQFHMLQELVAAEKVLSLLKTQKEELQVKTTESTEEKTYLDNQIKQVDREIMSVNQYDVVYGT